MNGINNNQNELTFCQPLIHRIHLLLLLFFFLFIQSSSDSIYCNIYIYGRHFFQFRHIIQHVYGYSQLEFCLSYEISFFYISVLSVHVFENSFVSITITWSWHPYHDLLEIVFLYHFLSLFLWVSGDLSSN